MMETEQDYAMIRCSENGAKSANASLIAGAFHSVTSSAATI